MPSSGELLSARSGIEGDGYATAVSRVVELLPVHNRAVKRAEK